MNLKCYFRKSIKIQTSACTICLLCNLSKVTKAVSSSNGVKVTPSNWGTEWCHRWSDDVSVFYYCKESQQEKKWWHHSTPPPPPPPQKKTPSTPPPSPPASIKSTNHCWLQSHVTCLQTHCILGNIRSWLCAPNCLTGGWWHAPPITRFASETGSRSL